MIEPAALPVAVPLAPPLLEVHVAEYVSGSVAVADARTSGLASPGASNATVRESDIGVTPVIESAVHPKHQSWPVI